MDGNSPRAEPVPGAVRPGQLDRQDSQRAFSADSLLDALRERLGNTEPEGAYMNIVPAVRTREARDQTVHVRAAIRNRQASTRRPES